MKVQKHSWRSPHLGLYMPVAVYGHFGTPILFFPTASADFEELERFGMIDALAHHIHAGRCKIVSCNAINDLSWFDDIHPGERIWRQELYDRYLRHELLPYILHDCGGGHVPVITAGASMGAYHAMNTCARHPGIVRGVIGMSGFYNIAKYADGYSNALLHFHNPVASLAGAWHNHDKWLLDSASINIVCGQGPWERVEWSREMSEALWRGGVHHNLDLWGYDAAHDWPWWKKQMDYYIRKLC